jgi:hypothetical protein
LEKLTRTIPVRDARGTRLTLFEFHTSTRRRGVLGLLRLAARRRRMELDTGEAVDYVDENTFKLPNGELLRRIRPET